MPPGTAGLDGVGKVTEDDCGHLLVPAEKVVMVSEADPLVRTDAARRDA